MLQTNSRKFHPSQWILITFLVVAASMSYATGLPYEDFINLLLESLTGPVAWAITAVVILAAALTNAIRPPGLSEGFANFIQVIMWVAIAMLAISVVTELFGPQAAGANLGG